MTTMTESSNTQQVNTNNNNNDNNFLKSITNLSPSIFLLIIISVGCVLSVLTVYFWKCLKKHQRKQAELSALTPTKSALKQHQQQIYAGVRADQQIEFVVPTITVNETPNFLTEDSMSESDCISNYTGYNSDREVNKRQSGRYQISPSDIKKGLYQNENNNQNNNAHGMVTFVLHYSYYRQQILVTLLSAKNLPQKNKNINPFAKIVMMPDKTPKYATKVHKNNPSPAFNELFTFPAKINTLNDKKLKITLWNSDTFSRKSFIGQCVYSLDHAGINNYINSDVISEEISCKLIGKKVSSGELLLSLTYKPEISTLTLTVLKLRNFPNNDINTVYVKVGLYQRKKKIRSRKSPLKKAQQEVEFNDTFHVHITNQIMSDITIIVGVFGRSATIGSKHLLGRTNVGEYCNSDQGKQHWNDAKLHNNSTVNYWHKLF